MYLFAFQVFKIIPTMVALKGCSDRDDTKDNNVAAAVVFDVDYFIKAEF